MPTYFTYDSVTSTNDVIKNLIRSHPEYLDSGCVVTAATQSSGRGTRGKSWHSTEPGGLYFSLAIQPTHVDFNKLDQLHLDIAACIKDLIADHTGTTLRIKKPNDLMLNGKKVGGIFIGTLRGYWAFFKMYII